MPASYPTSVKSFTTKTNTTTADASHINDVQTEIAAIETDLLAGLPIARGGTGLTSIGASGTYLGSNGSVASWSSVAGAYPAQGRLTLTTGTAVTTSDVTAATTLYYTPYRGNKISLYDGSSAWTDLTFAELSIAVPASTSQMYDVFVYNNSGTAALELLAWTNDTTRATALTFQNGVYVKTGATTRRYVGSFRTTTVSGQTEDSVTKRFVWNYYNRVARKMFRQETTASWTYSTATWRQANNSASNQLAVVIGVSEDSFRVDCVGASSNNSGSLYQATGIGVDVTNANSALGGVGRTVSTNTIEATMFSAYLATPAAGYHFYAWLENALSGTATTTWYGSGFGGGNVSGIQTVILG